MAHVNRSSLLSKLHKVLRKHFKPIPPPGQAVLEQLLFACCLENARYEAAEQAYAAISTSFFDWNEVRVSTIKELAEVMLRSARRDRRRQHSQAELAKRLRGDLFVRSRGPKETKPGPGHPAFEKVQRHDPLHGRIRHTGGLGRPFHPARSWCAVRAVHRGCCQRGGGESGRSERPGAHHPEEQRGRIRLAAAPIQRRAGG